MARAPVARGRRIARMLRRRTGYLMEGRDPAGGRWNYDKDNRKKYPARKEPPPVNFPEPDSFYAEALTYVESNFSDHLEVFDRAGQPCYHCGNVISKIQHAGRGTHFCSTCQR